MGKVGCERCLDTDFGSKCHHLHPTFQLIDTARNACSKLHVRIPLCCNFFLTSNQNPEIRMVRQEGPVPKSKVPLLRILVPGTPIFPHFMFANFRNTERTQKILVYGTFPCVQIFCISTVHEVNIHCLESSIQPATLKKTHRIKYSRGDMLGLQTS